MPNAQRAATPNGFDDKPRRSEIALLVLFAILLVLLTKNVSADEFTGQAQDDPKDLAPAPAPAATSETIGTLAFLPLPGWSRGGVMPPLPDQLRPMGKKVVVLTTPPEPAPTLAPPKDSAPTITTPSAPAPAAPSDKPTPATPPENPALIAVSPFLEWIKSNPQAAAAQARQQANSYRAPADASAPGTNGSPAASPTVPAPPENPYWLPPLIDSSNFGTSNGGSAAIYSTPQR